jgi:hypothetical protein
MASLLPCYEYDIFISYRQKDNKHDGWVTEFVDELRGELEATFKEDISIFFDENPNDGLLETHSVDKSLEGKLKCLIFIPIISQTYCDPKSFAWQHEFCAFNKFAKEDKYGRDIRLVGGNVASRILPVKIHDLDPEDKTLLKYELGGVLRCIEFIYKSAGVNRPLRVNEDHPHDNLNKTYYCDQINKVANAIKEIITAIKKYNEKKDPESNHSGHFDGSGPTTIEIKQPLNPEKTPVKKKSFLKGAILLLVGLVLLSVAVFLVYPVIRHKVEDTGPISRGDSEKVIIQPIKTDVTIENKVKSNKNNKPELKPDSFSKTTLILENGIYEGEVKNGKILHGKGKFTFTKEGIIPNDPEKRIAKVGYFLEGNWYDGEIYNVKLYDENGYFLKRIILGRY